MLKINPMISIHAARRVKDAMYQDICYLRQLRNNTKNMIGAYIKLMIDTGKWFSIRALRKSDRFFKKLFKLVKNLSACAPKMRTLSILPKFLNTSIDFSAFLNSSSFYYSSQNLSLPWPRSLGGGFAPSYWFSGSLE